MSDIDIDTPLDFPVTLRLEQIEVGHRLRLVDPMKVGALKASIEQLGLRTPISVTGDRGRWADPAARFTLRAGAHRLQAMRDLGADYIPALVRTDDDLDAELWEIDENLIRAELTPADRAIFVFRRKEIYLLKYPETDHGAIGNGREKSRQVGDSTEGAPKRFTAATAEATGQSERAVQRDAERGEKISDKALRMLRGTRHDRGTVLDRLKSLRTDLQEVYVQELFNEDKAKSAEAKEIRTDKMATKRAIKTDLINAIAAHGTVTAGEMPRAAFPIGYADPPWQQEAWSNETGQDKGLMYPPMPLDEIIALCAGERSPFTPDALIGLWAPTNRIDDAIVVLKGWGFDFKSMITWDKVDMGMGRWVRDQTEHLLIGTRGDFPGLEEGSQPRSLYSEKKGAHSRKPVWFAEMLDRLFPTMKKLELFQRKASLANADVRLNGLWDFWGFEAGDEASSLTEAAPPEPAKRRGKWQTAELSANDTSEPTEPSQAAPAVEPPEPDPVAEAVIAAGFAPNSYILVTLNGGLTYPGPLDIPSRLFRFPVSFVERKSADEVSRLLLNHPLLWQYAPIAEFLHEIEVKTGYKPIWEPQDRFGRDFGEKGRWYHAVDLATDAHWQDLLRTRQFTDPAKIFSSVVLQLQGKSLSLKNARAIMAEMESVEPEKEVSEHLLLGAALSPYRHDKGKLISPSIGQRDEPGAWMVIHGLESKFFNYVGPHLSVTADGMARRDAAKADEVAA